MLLKETIFALGRPTVYYPKLNRITGNKNATILLCYLSFWTEHTKDPGGWIYKTREDIQEETLLSRYEQEAARRALRLNKFIEEKRVGVPAQLYFRICLENITAAWNGSRDIKENNDPHRIANSIIREYESHIDALESRAESYALATGMLEEKVGYVDILAERGATCEICNDLITDGPGRGQRSLQFEHVVPGAHRKTNIRIVHADCRASVKFSKNKELDGEILSD